MCKKPAINPMSFFCRYTNDLRDSLKYIVYLFQNHLNNFDEIDYYKMNACFIHGNSRSEMDEDSIVWSVFDMYVCMVIV